VYYIDKYRKEHIEKQVQKGTVCANGVPSANTVDMLNRTGLESTVSMDSPKRKAVAQDISFQEMEN
jgi:hypothetical protein